MFSLNFYVPFSEILFTNPIGVTHPCGIRDPLLQDGSEVLSEHQPLLSPIGVTHPCDVWDPLFRGSNKGSMLHSSGRLSTSPPFLLSSILVRRKHTGAALSGPSYLSKRATYPCVRSRTHISPRQHETNLYGI